MTMESDKGVVRAETAELYDKVTPSRRTIPGAPLECMLGLEEPDSGPLSQPHMHPAWRATVAWHSDSFHLAAQTLLAAYGGRASYQR